MVVMFSCGRVACVRTHAVWMSPGVTVESDSVPHCLSFQTSAERDNLSNAVGMATWYLAYQWCRKTRLHVVLRRCLQMRIRLT